MFGVLSFPRKVSSPRLGFWTLVRSGRVPQRNAKARARALPQVPSRARNLSRIEVEDRRVFHPDGGDRPVRSVYGTSVKVFPKSRSNQRKDAVPAAFAFWNPSRVMVCVRRKMRREVLHAFGIAGGRGFKAPRMNWTSSISC